MRSLIKRIIGINHIDWYLIFVLSGILFVTWVIFNPAFAVERNTITDIKNEITNLENQIENLEIDADKKREQIINQEKIIDDFKEFLREVKRQAGNSWDAVLEITNAETNVNNSINSLDSMKNDLLNILNKQSEYLMEIDLLEDKLANSERIIRMKANTPDYVKLIGIDISKTCETLLKNNIETTCPGYDLLRQLDSSNTVVSGDWINPDGFVKRDTSPYENSWRWYDHDKQIRIIVDPPLGMSDRIKMITITNNFNVYFTPDDLKMDNNTRKWHEGRYVDACKNAVVSSDSWKKWLPDTIHYLRTNCQITGLEELQIEIIEKTEIDITTSPNYQYEQWMINAKEECKDKC